MTATCGIRNYRDQSFVGNFNWGAAIGPGITNRNRNQDDFEFIKALKAISPEDLKRMQDTANHPTVHCNRIEPAGNCMAGKGAHVVEKHGIGNKEIPQATGPEIYMDRFEHQNVTKAIMLIESALITSGPSGNSVEVTIPMVLTGRAVTLVQQAYVDVGWTKATIIAIDLVRSTVKLEF